MTTLDYDHFCRLVRERSGLVLTPDKDYLVRSRLEPAARQAGFGDVAALLAALRTNAPERLLQCCVDAMATHESFFFRDAAPFEQLAGVVLPALIAARNTTRSLRIWCAACSSGQEAYSVAIVLQEMAHRLAGWRVEILATDMSEPILQKAKSGIYSEFEAGRGLSPERRRTWFTPHPFGWQVSPTLQQMIQFRAHNLLQGTAGLGVFDVIFCRNVLIYLDVDRKRQILDELGQALAADGRLFLGSAETVMGLSAAFETALPARGLYRRTGPQLAQSA
jgi:chemotaxis protein methyltransferase CheR